MQKTNIHPPRTKPYPLYPSISPYSFFFSSKSINLTHLVFIGECNVVFVDDEIGSYMKDGEFVEVKHVGIMNRKEN
jgi:hypothetical protein